MVEIPKRGGWGGVRHLGKTPKKSRIFFWQAPLALLGAPCKPKHGPCSTSGRFETSLIPKPNCHNSHSDLLQLKATHEIHTSYDMQQKRLATPPTPSPNIGDFDGDEGNFDTNDDESDQKTYNCYDFWV